VEGLAHLEEDGVGIFSAGRPGSQIFSGLLSLFLGSAFTIISLLLGFGVLGTNGHGPADTSQLFWLVVLGLGGGIFALHTARYLLCQLAYQVRLEPDGALLFLSPFARRRASVHDLQGVERAEGPLIRGLDPRELRIRHREGIIRLRRLEDTDEFIERIKALNPRITVGGKWR
jgi:hypothetical protein